MIQDIHPHHFSNEYVATADIQENDHVFHFKGNALLLKQNGKGVEIPKLKEIEGANPEGLFLFTLNHVNCFLVQDCPEPEDGRFAYREVNSLRNLAEREIDWAGNVAFHLMNWYNQNRFCGKCGHPTVAKKDERALVCPDCGNLIFPKISPAIIVAVLCNDRILLASGVNFREGFYSLVAGYVDIGESIEDAVAREVKEEVGLDIKNIRYYKSQPWPTSGSMMIGFIADADEGQTIQIDEKEIVDAAWFSRFDLPTHPTERSIAGEIIEKFKKQEL